MIDMHVEYALVALGFFAFCGGLIDAAVGGGGLVQVPALLHALPQYSLATVLEPISWPYWRATYHPYSPM